MMGDYFTEPLQGSLFKKYQNMMMNVPSTKVSQDHRSVLKHENMQDTLSNVYTNECTSLRGRGNKWLYNNRIKFSNNHTYQY